MDIINSIGILDIIFICLLSISTIIGLLRGVIREVLSLVGLIASVYLAFAFSDVFSENYTSRLIEDSKISYIVTFVLIIVATLFAVTLINLFFSQLLRASGLSFVNRFFGAVFGILRGTLICSIIVMVISFVPNVSNKDWWKDSSLAPIFQQISKTTLKYLPAEVKSYFDSTQQNVEKIANQVITPTNQVAPSTPQAQSQRPTNTQNQQPNQSEDSNDSETQNILESIDASRQDSNNDSQETNKPKLILESYQN